MHTLLIAELAQAHEGSLGILHSYIDALAATGVDAVKFQTHIAEAESSLAEPFRIKFSYEDDTRYDYWKRMSFSLEQWRGIKDHCEEVGVEFISSPFSQTAVELLEDLEVKRYKIASGEVSNFLMLEKIAKTGKPIILSSCMSSYAELDAAIDFLRPFGNALSLLQCTTSYPTPPQRIGFNVLGEMMARYPDLTIGLSEHTSEIFTGLAAVAMGAQILEFHAVFDKRMFGPDAQSSLSIDQITELVRGVRFLESALANPVDKHDNSAYQGLKAIFEKSLAVRYDLAAGHELTFDDLETKKPSGQGLPASSFRELLGRPLKRAKKKYEFLTAEAICPLE